MAWQPELPAVVLRVSDETGSKTERRFWARENTAAGAGLGAAIDLAGLVSAASACSVFEAEMRYRVKAIPPANPAGGVSEHATGVLVFSTSEPTQFAIVEIPAIQPSLIDPDDYTRLKIDSGPVRNLIDAIKAGPYVNKFGYSIIDCIAALYEVRQ